MKQGSGHSSQGQHKQEPQTRLVNPGGADQLGQAMANRRAVTPLYSGKTGYTAPTSVNQVHTSGSQGKHR